MICVEILVIDNLTKSDILLDRTLDLFLCDFLFLFFSLPDLSGPCQRVNLIRSEICSPCDLIALISSQPLNM